MAFWSKQRWLEEGKRGFLKTPVLPWEPEKVEPAGYKLSIGREYYVNKGGGSTVQQLEKNQGFVIEPGQFAFILTKEKVYVSESAIGFISIRASIKFLGLVNVSGFQVNPGHRGNLVFAVFNAGPKHVHLREGKSIFSLWMADLDAPTNVTGDAGGKIPSDLENIPDDVINGIAGEAMTAYQVSEQISELKTELQKIKNRAIQIGLGLAVIVSLTTMVFGKQFAQSVIQAIKPAAESQVSPHVDASNSGDEQ